MYAEASPFMFAQQKAFLKLLIHNKTLLSHSVLTMSEKMQLHKVEDL